MDNKEFYINKSKNMIKATANIKGYNLSALNELLNTDREKKTTFQNFNQKINNGSIRFIEVLEIADKLGLNIQFIDK